MKLDERKRKIIMYAGLGVAAVVGLLLYARARAGDGQAANVVYLGGRGGGGAGAGESGFIPAAEKPRAPAVGGLTVAPGSAIFPTPTPSPCEGRRVLPCLIPPCPCAGDDGAVITPPSTGGGDTLAPKPRTPSSGSGGFSVTLPPIVPPTTGQVFSQRNAGTRETLAASRSDDTAMRPALRPVGVRLRAGTTLKV